MKRHVKRNQPVLAEEERLPPPPIAPLRLVDGRCAYAFPRGKVRCWRMTVTCARTCCRWLVDCPWLAKIWS